VVVADQVLLGEELADHELLEEEVADQEAEWVSVHELLEEEGADHTLLEEEVVFIGQAAARLVKNERTETALMEFILKRER
jgi:hypothetical protein